MRRPQLVGLAFSLLTTTVQAQTQWQVTFEAGSTTFSSAAHDTNSPTTHVRAALDAMYTLRVAREGSRVGVALALSYASGFLAGNVEDFVVIPGDEIQLVEIAPEARIAIGRTGTGAALWLHLGPVIDRWSVGGNDAITRVGGLVGGTLALPLSERWRVDVRGDFALSASYVETEEEGPNLIRPSTMRRGRVALGITRRL